MRPSRLVRSAARILPLLCLALAAPHAAMGWSAAPDPPELSPDARARLTQAAGDARLDPWQQDLMLRLARDVAAPDAEPVGAGPTAPERQANEVDGAWQEPIIAGRDGHSAIYDPIRDRMIIFGGFGSTAYLNDVWALSLAGAPTWTRLRPSGTPPSVRWTHSAIYDPLRDRMVVFGGYDGSYRNDVWALSLAGEPAWTLLTPTGTPPATRGRHVAIYDPVRDRMVIIGGYNGSYLGDVWALSLAGTTAWVGLSPTGGPSARWGQSAVYDSARDRVVIFGGYDNLSGARNDVWALSLAGPPAWTMLTPTGTPPSMRWGHGAIYDPPRDRMVVYGGWDGSVRSGDVWALSLSDAPAWTALTPAGAQPMTRSHHGAIYDPVRERLVVFGGYTNYPPGVLDDAWALSLPGAPAWSALPGGAGLPPGARYGHVAIHDPVRDRMIVFGGSADELWTLSLAGAFAWAPLTPIGTPPTSRRFSSAIYDPRRDRLVVFGGSDGAVENDVWALSLADPPTWTALAPAGSPPTARQAQAAIYDPVRDRMVIFGGTGAAIFGDAWALSLGDTPTWTMWTPAGTPPGPRGSPAAIYDPVHDRMLVFGGFDYTSTARNDVWALSLTDPPTWTALAPSGTPPGGRSGHTAIGDPVRGRMLVFGGSGTSSFDDVWALSLADPPAWTQLVPDGALPVARYDHSAIYDPLRDRMLVFGGYGSGTSRNDLWTLTWGAPGLAAVTCPGDLVWTPGASAPVSYGVTDPYGFAQTADYTLTSERDWPGFPITGSATVGASTTTPLVIPVPVPDSVASGLNTLTFQVRLRGVPQVASCSLHLHDATTPVLVSLVSATADPDRVRLVWWSGEGAAATVYRCAGSPAWSGLGRVTADGSGQIVYEDRSVRAGTRYGYRLGVLDQGQEVFAGVTWVDVPLAPRFALAGARPNPTTRDLAVVFSLPDGAPARLELYDVAGRRVVTREVGSLGGGSHVVRLGAGRVLASGLYVVRLTRADRTLTTRVVVIQ